VNVSLFDKNLRQISIAVAFSIIAVSYLGWRWESATRQKTVKSPAVAWRNLVAAANAKDKATIIKFVTPRGMGRILNDNRYAYGSKLPSQIGANELEQFKAWYPTPGSLDLSIAKWERLSDRDIVGHIKEPGSNYNLKFYFRETNENWQFDIFESDRPDW